LSERWTSPKSSSARVKGSVLCDVSAVSCRSEANLMPKTEITSRPRFVPILHVSAACFAWSLSAGCGQTRTDVHMEAPSSVEVVTEGFSLIEVAHPERFTLVPAKKHISKSQLTAVGMVISSVPSWATRVASAKYEVTNRTPSHMARSGTLSRVWIECDGDKIDFAGVTVGVVVSIRAHDGRDSSFAGRVSELRSVFGKPIARSKVRIEAKVPESVRVGTLVIAAFPTYKNQVHAAIPASAMLSFHGHNWVYVSSGPTAFSRVEVVAGNTLPHNMQEIVFGIKPTDSVVKNPIALRETPEQ
jgi:hypothetical protein